MADHKNNHSTKKPLEHLVEKEHSNSERTDERHDGHHFVMIGIIGIVAIIGMIAMMMFANTNAGMAYQAAEIEDISSEELPVDQTSCIIIITNLIYGCQNGNDVDCDLARAKIYDCFQDSSQASSS